MKNHAETSTWVSNTKSLEEAGIEAFILVPDDAIVCTARDKMNSGTPFILVILLTTDGRATPRGGWRLRNGGPLARFDDW